jgi:hypothetical protein
VTTRELLEQVGLYNPVPADAEAEYLIALAGEYAAFCGQLEVA